MRKMIKHRRLPVAPRILFLEQMLETVRAKRAQSDRHESEHCGNAKGNAPRTRIWCRAAHSKVDSLRDPPVCLAFRGSLSAFVNK